MNSETSDAALQGDSFDKENYLASGKKEVLHDLYPGKLTKNFCEENRCILQTDNGVKLAVCALSEEILHFTFAPNGHLGDGFSYATLSENFPHAKAPTLSEEGADILLATSRLQVRVAEKGLLLTISDEEGQVMSEDEKGFHWEPHSRYGGNIVQHSRRIQPREIFYGLGDKSCHSEIRGRRFELWGSDTYAYGTETDPLYKNIPFFIGIHHGKAYGIFFDSTHRSYFDFGKERADVSSFWAQGGLMNFYYIHGPSVAEVVRRFAKLTGVPELPPLWSLGFHQCKWSYRTEKELTTLAQGFLDHEIPCDALYVDIDYMDGYRCFTWNLEAFPRPGEMIRELEGKGFKTVAIIDPGIKVDPGYFVYDEGIAGDHFCKEMDGDIYTGKVWPGDCHFPDFTKPSVRDWWAGLFDGLIKDDGLAGIWNDMNEPADFNDDKTFPRHIRHDYDGHPCSHRRAHNVYGTQMIRATREGIARFNGGKRPFAITRSAYAGAWRYACAWTGDNISTWEHLRIANLQCQRLNLSGYSFVGSDIGGFLDQTNGELFTRWIQLGIFHPFCRVHSSGEHGDQEPWSFGEPYTSIVRKFLELRYRLLPYFYTTFYQHIEKGDPMLRPLIYLDHTDSETIHRADEFAVGDNLMVCPVQEKEAKGRWMYLTKGHYYNYWTDELVCGGEEIFCEAELDRIPLFVRSGALLPLDPVRQYSWQKVSAPQEHHLYLPTESCGAVESQLYADSGDHYDYQDGHFALATFTCERVAADKVVLAVRREGDFPLPKVRLHLHGLTGKPKSITVDGKKVAPALEFTVPAAYERIEIEH
ncbi:glycoside hydrolase family 31 protein [Roseibacillus ishigakijimensis]|uniref:Glycoside hydrolase family 31 protein n=1 Tax=Roseibacillus ishigakijimensis TaxID=454146 RepID=A0A934RJM1_9BACT|nr:glycoside hydrolase family 31 protein [Roseibacillus ishigakijimensis]MBK1832882.1 glycoside hydrolase family 31 protein [Roseibacillus ishigakijimensis]